MPADSQPSSPPLPPTGKAPVSVIVPTRNEASNLGKCLDHLQWADEVVVIDSGSTDGTAEIARDRGARVIDFRWNRDWPKKKGWALAHAELRHEWVLIVDADEWIVPELADEIGHAIRRPDIVGYYINRKWMFMGRWLRHGGWYPSWNLRLVRRGHAAFERIAEVADTGSGDNEVHEHLIADGPTEHLKNDMIHMAFGTIDSFVEKHNRYSNWEAIVQLQDSSPPAAGDNRDLARRRKVKDFARRLPFRPTLRFIHMYILKRGFLDGRAGWVIARLVYFYEFLSVAKYHELRRQQRESESKLSDRTSR